MMKRNHQQLLSYHKGKGCEFSCVIDLSKLFQTEKEREKFEGKWEAFLNSDPDNRKIYKKEGDKLLYKSEQLIPTKKDKRPPLLLVLGNPATHSVQSGMFFSFKEGGKENRFWKNILKPAGVLDLPFNVNQSAKVLNNQRRDKLISLKYKSPFRIGLCVFITMPSAAGGKWGGVAGVQKVMGIKALRRLEEAEQGRILECASKFVTPQGAVVTFQKNAWNNLCSERDPKYNLELAKVGKLKGTLKNNTEISLLCVPPTRLIGPCRYVLNKFANEMIG